MAKWTIPDMITRSQADAMVAAAVRRAAEAAKTRDAKWMRKKYEITYAKLRYDVLSVQRCENKFANILSEDIEDAILDLITEDAQTALAKMLAEARADRIEELEAKLAKAVGALRLSRDAINGLVDSGDAFDDINATLAELTGDKDE